MTGRVLVLALLLLIMPAAAAAQPIPVQCARTADLLGVLRAEHHERPILRKVEPNGVVLQLWVERGGFDDGLGRSWTITAHRNSGVSCILASGTDAPAWIDDFEWTAL